VCQTRKFIVSIPHIETHKGHPITKVSLIPNNTNNFFDLILNFLEKDLMSIGCKIKDILSTAESGTQESQLVKIT